MTDDSEHAGEKPPMHPKLAEFLDETFPNDGRQHVLMVGERHDAIEHTRWLIDHLDTLLAHDVRAIGMELPIFMNVFFWAYADGTLTRELGSQQAAREYVENVCSAMSIGQDASRAHARLAMNALDRGMHYVCYDARRSFEGFSDYIAIFPERNPEGAERMQTLLHGSDRLQASALVAKEKEALIQKLIPTDTPLPPFEYSVAWVHQEVTHWLEGNPDYRRKLQAIDRAISVGQRHIGEKDMGSDGLSACIAHALMPKEGNRITISGLNHNLGVPVGFGSPVMNVHGLFSHHMQEVAAHYAGVESAEDALHAHRVSVVAMASSDKMAQYKDAIDRNTRFPNVMYVPSAIPMMNLDDGTQHTVISYKKEDVARLRSEHHTYVAFSQKSRPNLTERWFFSEGELERMREGRARQFANPMLIPELKNACDKVHAIMHGEPQRAR